MITVAGFDKTKLVNVLTEKRPAIGKDAGAAQQADGHSHLVRHGHPSDHGFGPLGALLVELSPVRTRYSGVSVALQLGSGWIGGFASFVATAVVIATGRLWYAVVFAGLTRSSVRYCCRKLVARDINL
ncbi:hypothetical protein [Bradyrhizobium sp. LMG 9283]|uniref:hypothetical protein n=1 Tax=Bradyrhizobium sp. LMG 9283 TaxID=592064 RepID=UPI00388F3791